MENIETARPPIDPGTVRWVKVCVDYMEGKEARHVALELLAISEQLEAKVIELEGRIAALEANR